MMERVRDFGREQARRLNEAYARWHKKHRERQGRDGEQERGPDDPGRTLRTRQRRKSACTHIYVRTAGPSVIDRGRKHLLPLPRA